MAAKKLRRRNTAQRVGLSRERVLAAALSLADEGGIASLSMRAVASLLRVEAMSLYHHVSNKEDLLDGMVDMVFAEIPLPTHPDWQTALRQRAIAIHDALMRHRWAVGVLVSRRHPGPATLRHSDAAIGRLREAGFSIQMVAHALSLLDSYVFGFVMQEQQLPLSTDHDIQQVASDILAAGPPETYPHLAALATQHVMKPGYAYSHELRFGLELLLDGLSAHLEQPQKKTRRS